MEGEYLKVEARGYNDHYDKVVGDTPFAKAVNKKVSDYWVATGVSMPIETASFLVLADLYNKLTV